MRARGKVIRGKGTPSTEHMLHHGGLDSVPTPFGARMHVAEEERLKALTTNDGRDIWRSSRYRLPVGGMFGETDERLDHTMDGWTGHQEGGGAHTVNASRCRYAERPPTYIHSLLLSGARVNKEKDSTRSIRSKNQLNQSNKSYLVSLETGLSFDLQSAGVSVSFTAAGKKNNNKNKTKKKKNN